jgi:transcription termination/antitermination protein NusA
MADGRDKHAAAVALFVKALDLSMEEARAFADEGHTSVEELAFVPIDELFEVKGLDRERILEIRLKAHRSMLPGQSG